VAGLVEEPANTKKNHPKHYILPAQWTGGDASQRTVYDDFA